ncbi:MAG TPA: helix-turn-helix domain-containing protein [Acidimicrobiales bacterium]|nr:helix-turn-helix domain-containing protein [Acidimicrobiales bacterium]
MTDEPDPEALPPVLAVAWQRTPPPARGPRPSLTVAAIVGAAVEIADEEGIDAVSMARVAGRLGYTPMALYRHVRSKDDLLALAQDAAFADPPTLDAAAGWRPGLEAWTRALAAAYRARPWVLDIPIAGPPSLPRQVAWLDRALAVLEGTPLLPHERLSAALMLSNHARSWSMLARDLERSRGSTGTGPPAGTDALRLVAELAAPDRFPAVGPVLRDVLAAIEAGDDDGEDVADEFEFGLQRILDGLDAHMRRA